MVVPAFILLLVGLVSSAPVSDDVLTVTSEFFPDSLAIYTSQHDIVNLFCPLNALNFEDSDMDAVESTSVYTFFVEADTVNGEYDYKGLYVLKDKVATKLLDNGVDFAATTDDKKTVYFAATDGIYVYNAQQNTAEKYGTLTDSFIGIAIIDGTDYLLALAEDHVLYKVTNEGTQKEVVSDVKDAVQIVMDFENNLFFLDTKKNVYVKKMNGAIKKIKGIPNNPSYAKLIRPPFVLEEGVVFVGGKKVFELYPNGTSENQNLLLKDRPTAYSIEATLIQYYAFNKKIYEYNVLAIVLGEIEIALEELKSKLEQKSDDIKAMGAKSKKALRRQ